MHDNEFTKVGKPLVDQYHVHFIKLEKLICLCEVISLPDIAIWATYYRPSIIPPYFPHTTRVSEAEIQ